MKENAPPDRSAVDAHREVRRLAVAELRKIADQIESQIDAHPEHYPVSLFAVCQSNKGIDRVLTVSCPDDGVSLIGLVELEKARLSSEINQAWIKQAEVSCRVLNTDPYPEPTDGYPD